MAEQGFFNLENDDGRHSRTGTLVTSSAHIITALIGSGGMLSLAGSMAALGWVVGPALLVAFSVIPFSFSRLLVDSYRRPFDRNRSRSYGEPVRAHLGVFMHRLRFLVEYVDLVGVAVGYTTTAAISMGAMKRSNCFSCEASSTTTTITVFAVIQIILSQLPKNFHKPYFLSIVAAFMSLASSLILLGLSIQKIAASGVHVNTTVWVDVATSESRWEVVLALANLACDYSFACVLIRIQDTLRSSAPEDEVMKKACFIGVSVTTMFYMLCGLLAYAAYGNDTPANLLTGLPFYDDHAWLSHVGNLCITLHLIVAYQVFCQPIYQVVEDCARGHWPDSAFLNAERVVRVPVLGNVLLSPSRLVWRTAYVTVTALVAVIFPFNSFLRLLDAVTFWPLTVYFPVQMYMAQAKTPRLSLTWTWMTIVSFAFLVVSLLAAAGSVKDLIKDLEAYKLFN